MAEGYPFDDGRPAVRSPAPKPVVTLSGMWRDIPQDKRAARAQIRAARRDRDPLRRAADGSALAGHLADAIAASPVGCAAAYTALPTEPPTRDLNTMLHRAGWRVMLPVLLPDKDLAWESSPVDGAAGGGGGAQHGPDHLRFADVLIVPALAIDRRGLRLGQGGGSYDRALARRRPGAFTIALVYDEELVDAVPSEPHDLGVDAVITPHAGLRYLRD